MNTTQTTLAHSAIDAFLSAYAATVQEIALRARATLLRVVPGCSEQLDAKAKVIGYGFGPGYSDTVCVLIFSKNGVKLGLPDGADFPDPVHLLRGEGRRHRHIELATPELIESRAVKTLVVHAMRACCARREVKKTKPPRSVAKQK